MAAIAQYHGGKLLARHFIFDSPDPITSLDIIKKWSAAR
jgi:hypothetical protein